MIILEPNSPYFHLFSFFFLCSAFFERDVLLIRTCLVLAYVFIVANSITGFPSWPNFYTDPPRTSPDAIAWGVFTALVHLRGFYILLRDQKPAKFASDDEEALARFLYRRAGMREWEAHEAIKKGQMVRVAAGEIIRTDRTSLYLLVEGKATFRTCVHGVEDEERTARSGDLLDLAVLNAVGVRVGFMEVEFNAKAVTDCLLLRWPLQALVEMADGSWPALGAGWQAFALYTVAAEFGRRSHRGMDDVPVLDSAGEPETQSWLDSGRSRDFGPWTALERPAPHPSVLVRMVQSVRGYALWVANSFTPTPIKGLRHLGPVPSGLAAQQQLLEVAALSQRTNGTKKTMFISGWYGKNSKADHPFSTSGMKMIGNTNSTMSLTKPARGSMV